MVNENYRHKGLRKKMVDSLRERGIVDERVLEAMNKVPRHLFLDSSFLEFAYQDKAFPIGSGQTISQPYTVAYQTELLDLKKGEKVLEIGTGSGYQACILWEMGAKVYSVERQRRLFEKTRELLPRLGYYPKLFYGDGYLGLSAFAPYDKILITAAIPEVPAALISQIKPGGHLVAPIGPADIQTMTIFLKRENGSVAAEALAQFRFVPMLSDKAKD